MTLLKIDNLQYLDFPVLNLELNAGETISISGPSGIGKSLLLRAIADLDPHSGHIFLNDVESGSIPPEQWRLNVGFLPAESQWWEDVVADHFPLNVASDQTFSSWLDSLQLQKTILNSQTSRLSSGERQRLALIRLLNNRPKVLLLDEPTASLDSTNTKHVETIIAEYIRSTHGSAIWVSHDIDQAERVASRHFRFEGKALVSFLTQEGK
ncbi:MAG: ATP-binding cassette domain-containing protein [Desulfobulbaceae bacterium]|uniref:ATP-binding cassette domain-containing protein n=1 Tax=Candidatus Desulfobia pelagia TaxID=2841692 RepID=A0A8J6NF36_9BACT|nr:ATP-binding cassette domain-containing protein [Candidatus Desulfobia pelagia]